jgi:uncharacterized membrane protein
VIGKGVVARVVTDQYANNRIEADQGRLKAGLRPMRGLRRASSLQTIAAGHAFVQNLRRGHYELATEKRPGRTSPRRIRRTRDQLLTFAAFRAGAARWPPLAVIAIGVGVVVVLHKPA